MKTLVVYSSLSGNTKYLAEGIYDALKGEKDIKSVKEADNWKEYDRILVGYWVDKGGPDKNAKEFLEKLKDKRVGVFATLGAYPDSEHAKTSLEAGVNIIKENNIPDASFICQGRLSEAIKSRLKKMPKDHSHYPDEKRLKRWKDAESHPNEEDVKDAVKVFVNEA